MENQLSVIVKESGLEKTKAQILLDNFSNYFQIAGEWEKKAKAIVVSNANQITEMKMARVGRLFLREKRIAIEKTRKNLKEQALREGKAIDGIANILKALIVPIEEYLEKQEKFVEIEIAREAKRRQIEAEQKAEQEQIAKEEAEAKERKRIRKENEQLKREAEEREQKIVEERIRVEKEKEIQEEKVRKEREAAERAASEERKRHEQDLMAERAKAEEKQRAHEEKAKKEKEAIEARMIECPFCHRSFVSGMGRGE